MAGSLLLLLLKCRRNDCQSRISVATSTATSLRCTSSTSGHQGRPRSKYILTRYRPRTPPSSSIPLGITSTNICGIFHLIVRRNSVMRSIHQQSPIANVVQSNVNSNIVGQWQCKQTFHCFRRSYEIHSALCYGLMIAIPATTGSRSTRLPMSRWSFANIARR